VTAVPQRIEGRVLNARDSAPILARLEEDIGSRAATCLSGLAAKIAD
jgi:hypothetical protein